MQIHSDLSKIHFNLQIYNLGTGVPYSVLDMVEMFEKVSGKKVSMPELRNEKHLYI